MGKSVGGSGGGSFGYRGDVDCVILGHILHVHWRKWLGVLFLPWWWNTVIRDNGGGDSDGESGGQIGNRKTAASGVDSFLRDIVWLVSSSRASSFIPMFFILALLFFISVDIFAFREASTSNIFSQKQKTK